MEVVGRTGKRIAVMMIEQSDDEYKATLDLAFSLMEKGLDMGGYVPVPREDLRDRVALREAVVISLSANQGVESSIS